LQFPTLTDISKSFPTTKPALPNSALMKNFTKFLGAGLYRVWFKIFQQLVDKEIYYTDNKNSVKKLTRAIVWMVMTFFTISSGIRLSTHGNSV